jgi:hypothetical protein
MGGSSSVHWASDWNEANIKRTTTAMQATWKHRAAQDDLKRHITDLRSGRKSKW